jgi:hypothetical protein
MSDDAKTDCQWSEETSKYLNIFREAAQRIPQIFGGSDVLWEPNLGDPRRFHNMYVSALVAVYVCKYQDLSESILAALERQDYLTYALCGRALIEMVATLRYYLKHQYGPFVTKFQTAGKLTADDYRALLKIDDNHLRGSRFDWESFILRRFEKMQQAAMTELQKKGAKNQQERSEIAQAITAAQVSVLTCVKKWADEKPGVLIAYSLFCDLVHPNVGSSLLVSSAESGRLYFGKGKSDAVGHRIFEQSFPLLLSVTTKPFGDLLARMMALRWQEDELR